MMTKDKLRQLTAMNVSARCANPSTWVPRTIDDGTEPVLTIAGLWYGSVTLQRGKKTRTFFPSRKSVSPASCRYAADRELHQPQDAA